VEKRHDTIRKGELEKPGLRYLERMKGIERSQEEIVDNRGRKLGEKHVRRQKLDSRTSEARAEFARGGRVEAVVLSQYETNTGEMRRHERQTPDGDTLRVVERDANGYYESTDFDKNRAGDQPVRREEFDDGGQKIGSESMTYSKVDIDGERQFLLTKRVKQNFVDGNPTSSTHAENSYDKLGRITEEKETTQGEGQGKREMVASHLYEDGVETIESSEKQYSSTKATKLDKTSEATKRIENGLLMEESSRTYNHGEEPLSDSAQKMLRDDYSGTMKSLKAEGRTVRATLVDGKEVYVEVTKILESKKDKSYRYDGSGQLTGDTEKIGQKEVVSEYGYKKGKLDSAVKTVNGEATQELQYKYGRNGDKPERIVVTDHEKHELRAYRPKERGEKSDLSAPQEGYVVDTREELAA